MDKKQINGLLQSQIEANVRVFSSYLAIGNEGSETDHSMKCQFYYPDMPQDEECISNPNKSTNE